MIDFACRTESEARVVSLSRALAEPGSPGRAFKLTDNAALDLLREAAEGSEVVTLGSSAGMPQLTMSRPPEEAVRSLLVRHYGTFGARLVVNVAGVREGVA